MNDSYLDKARGMLIGLAIGDALGAPYEFGYTSSKIVELGDEIAHFRDHRIPKGVWTDDTEMALCLADSILENDGYDSYDVMEKYSRWMNEGYRTYDGLPAADVGYQTRRAIVNFKRDPEYLEETGSAGNGAIMRVAPVVIAGKIVNKAGSKDERDNIQEMARLSCKDTHNSYMAIAVTEAFASLLALCFTYDGHLASAIEHCTCWLSRDNEQQRNCEKQIHERITAALTSENGNEFKDRGGYILDAFTIAVWAAEHSSSFEEGLLKVIRLGGDTDTNGAIYGQLAGALYGYDKIPKEWRDGVYASDELIRIADELYKMKNCRVIRSRFEGEPGPKPR